MESANLSKSLTGAENARPSSPTFAHSVSSADLLELAIAPLLKNCAKVETPPPKYTIKPIKDIPAHVRLREGLRSSDQHDLAISMRTKSSGTLRNLPNQVNGKFYTDSEYPSENEESADYSPDGQLSPHSLENGVFRFDLNSTSKSDTINNKMPLIKSLHHLRKFKLGLAPRRKLKIIDEHLSRSSDRKQQVFQEIYDYDRIAPQSKSFGKSPSVTMPTSHPNSQSKRVVIKPSTAKAVALSAESQGIPPPSPHHPISRSSTASNNEAFIQPIPLNAKDTRSYDDSQFGPLYSAAKQSAQKMDMAPLLDMALAQGSDTDSVTIDSYREDQREHFLQHNISRTDEEISGTRSRTQSRMSSDLSMATISRANLPNGSLVRRPKKYANDAEDFGLRSSADPKQLLRAATAPEIRPVTPKEVPTVAHVPLAQQLSFRMDPNPHPREKSKVKVKFTDPFKAPLRCVTCFKAAELWCTQCVQAYCVMCWNRVAHHALFNEETLPEGRVHSSSGRRKNIVNTNDESPAVVKKSYSSKVLFTQYQASSPPSRPEQSPAPKPHEFDFFEDPFKGKQVYLQADGAVKMEALPFDDDVTSRPDSHTLPSRNSPPRSRSGDRRKSKSSSDFRATVAPAFHYQSEQDQFRPHSTGKIVIKAGSGARPKSPAFSATASNAVNISFSKRHNPAAHAIVGISHDFHPVDWREGLFTAKDPLSIANKHAIIDLDKPSEKEIAVLDGVPVRILVSR